ncbi:MAG: dephospho-CoA kinase [Aliidiomarina sp.]|uniref:dephospho-CoA kinase n=1 Tax=Aliidiomarina sp. TaxID=1872439 RepID=UPI0025C41923|nr:dephospho-CoA kinase [Aliidiomarina sp.]MCH8501298.1 dephospho-CoA kinase [Aliidiomarina sp.]
MNTKQKHIWVLGVTGGIGSGKSTATDRFASLGISVVDADQVARDVVAAGTPALQAIAERFGDNILQANGELDRAALRAIIFADPSEKAWLNTLLHPAIREHMLTRIQSAHSPYVVLSAPLLLENGLEQYTDRVLVIDVPEALQIERTQARDQVDTDQISAIMAAQLSREDRIAKADDILDNSGSVAELHAKIDRLHEYYLRIALSS